MSNANTRHLSQSAYNIPSSLGFVEEKYQSLDGGELELVLLQDAHSNDSAQLNIYEILKHIWDSNDDMRYIFLESASGDESLSFLRPYKKLHDRENIALSYLRKGKIQGPEYFDIVSEKRSVNLWGVEDLNLYKKAWNEYYFISQNRSKSLDYIKKIKNTINVLKPSIYNPQLFKLDQFNQKYLDDNLSVIEYLDLLISESKTQNISFSKSSLEALMELRKIESSIDFKKANREIKEFLLSLPEEKLKKLELYFEKDNVFSLTSFSAKNIYHSPTFFEDLSKEISKSEYSELKKYAKYVSMFGELRPRNLIDDIYYLESEIYNKLTQSKEERKLHSISKKIDLINKSLDLSLTPEEFVLLKNQDIEKLILDSTGFLNHLIRQKNKNFEKALFVEEELDDVVESSIYFYQLTYDRDLAFVRNLLQKMKSENQKKAVLVAGGFHSRNLKKILKKYDISFTSIQPNTLHSTDKGKYENLLLLNGKNPVSSVLGSGREDTIRVYLRQFRPEVVESMEAVESEDKTKLDWAAARLADASGPSTYPKNNPQSQFSDLYSRLGIWMSDESNQFGVDHASLASQRTGKLSFLNPLLNLKVSNTETGGDVNFSKTVQWYPWGIVQKGVSEDFELDVVITFAEQDTVLVSAKIKSLKPGNQTRLILRFGSEFSHEVFPESPSTDRDYSLSYSDGNIVMAQTATPTESRPGFALREEPNFRIVTGIRPRFDLDQEPSFGDSDLRFELGSKPLDFTNESEIELSFIVSVSSHEIGGEGDAAEVVRRKLDDDYQDSDTLISQSQERWSSFSDSLPKAQEEKYDPLVHRAALTIATNTVRPQPEVGYGRKMNGFTGTFPARGFYEAFWIWDVAFQSLALAEWDVNLAKDNIRLILSNQNEDGSLEFLHPDSSSRSDQPPLLSLAVWRIYEEDHDADFLREVYPKLKKWNDWRFNQNGDGQDRFGNGLLGWNDVLHSGWDNSPRFDNGVENLAAVDLNSFVYLDMKTLARIALEINQPDEGEDFNSRADRLGKTIVDTLYDDESGLFWDYDTASGSFVKVLTPTSFLPLWAGVPLPDGAANRMIETYLLSEDHFFGEVPFPTVAYSDQAYEPNFYWRGPVWLNLAYMMTDILHQNGYEADFRLARRRLLELVDRHPNIYEYYNSATGDRGEGPWDANIPAASNFSWSAAFTILMGINKFGITADVTSSSQGETAARLASDLNAAKLQGEPIAEVRSFLETKFSAGGNPSRLRRVDKFVHLEEKRRDLKAEFDSDAHSQAIGKKLAHIKSQLGREPGVAMLAFTAMPVMGGVNIVMGHQAMWLAQAGVEVKVLAGNENGHQEENLTHVHVPDLKEFDSSTIPANAEALEFYQDKTDRIYETLKKHIDNMDLVVIHNVMTVRLNLPFTRALHRLIRENPTKRFIIYTHNIEGSSYPEFPLNLLNLSHRNYRSPNVQHVTVSNYYKDFVSGVYGIGKDRFEIVHPGIDVYAPTFVDDISINLFESNNLFDQDYVFVFPARIDWNKDIGRAVQVLESVINQGKSAKLVFFNPGAGTFDEMVAGVRKTSGDGAADYLLSKRDIIENHVVIFDSSQVTNSRQHRQVIWDVIALSDALLFPSKMETFGMPPVEAASVGTAPIVSDLPAHRETMRGDAFYIGVDNDLSGIGAPLVPWLDEHTSEDEGSSADKLRTRVLDEFTWDHLMQRDFLRVWRELNSEFPTLETVIEKVEAFEIGEAIYDLKHILSTLRYDESYKEDLIDNLEDVIHRFESRADIYLSPDQPFWYLYRGVSLILEELKKEELTFEQIQRHVRQLDELAAHLLDNPDDVGQLNEIAIWLEVFEQREDDLEKVDYIRVYRRVLEIDPRNTQALNALMRWRYHKEDNRDGALEIYEQIRQIDGSNQDAHYFFNAHLRDGARLSSSKSNFLGLRVFISKVLSHVTLNSPRRLVILDQIFNITPNPSGSFVVVNVGTGARLSLSGDELKVLSFDDSSADRFELPDLMLEYEDNNFDFGIFDPAILSSPKVIVLDTDIFSNTLIGEEKIEFIVSRLNKLHPGTIILLKGQQASLWKKYEPRPGLFVTELPIEYQDAPHVHIVGQQSDFKEFESNSRLNRWVVLNLEKESDQDVLFQFESVFEYSQLLASLDEKALNDPTNTLANTLFQYHTQSSSAEFDRDRFGDVITNINAALEFPLEPLKALNIHLALRFYQLMLKMTSQSA